MRKSGLLRTGGMYLILSTSAALSQDRVLYCTEDHVTGLAFHEERWVPAYTGRDKAERYTIKFNEDYTRLNGVGGTDTLYMCHYGFPTKAPEVVTCINTMVDTMAFNFNTETERFQMTQVSPGGWLSVGTERADEIGLLTDHLAFGTCQGF